MAKVLKINPANPDYDALCTVVHEIIHGRVIVYPTDTLYGIGVDACNPDAVGRVFKIKKRDPAKPILILVNSIEMAAAFVEEIPESAMALIRKFWPGPLTLVFKASSRLSGKLTGGAGTVGVRFPKHPFSLKIMDMCNHPITSTSANISGENQPLSIQDIVKIFDPSVDLIVDAGDLKTTQPSTVVDVTSTFPRLIREGAIDRSALSLYITEERN